MSIDQHLQTVWSSDINAAGPDDAVWLVCRAQAIFLSTKNFSPLQGVKIPATTLADLGTTTLG